MHSEHSQNFLGREPLLMPRVFEKEDARGGESPGAEGVLNCSFFSPKPYAVPYAGLATRRWGGLSINSHYQPYTQERKADNRQPLFVCSSGTCNADPEALRLTRDSGGVNLQSRATAHEEAPGAASAPRAGAGKDQTDRFSPYPAPCPALCPVVRLWSVARPSHEGRAERLPAVSTLHPREERRQLATAFYLIPSGACNADPEAFRLTRHRGGIDLQLASNGAQ